MDEGVVVEDGDEVVVVVAVGGDGDVDEPVVGSSVGSYPSSAITNACWA